MRSTALPQPTPEQRAHSSLLCYVASQYPNYQIGAHHRLIADKLSAVERGEIKRLVITVPPRHGKSMLASEFFPAWYLSRNPTHQVLFVTYAQELASGFGRKVRNRFLDASHAAIFPYAQLAPDSQSAKSFATRQGGAYHAVGAGGPITGRGAHLLLIDDPIKNREEAESEVQREKLKDWYTSTAYTRLMPGGAVIVIQTRWHGDDLAGWLLNEHAHEGWDLVNLPALAETDDPLGRLPGDALWPEAYPIERLAEIRRAVGTRDWSALYQQRPVPAAGGMIKLSWLRRYDTLPGAPEMVVQSWDTAQKAGEAHDPSVCTTWALSAGRYYLLHVLRIHADFPEVRRHILLQSDKFHPQAILIEDAASGTGLAQDLRLNTRLPVIPIATQGKGKQIRMLSASPAMEAGLVWVPERADWLADYESELAAFPLGKHDDQVDSTSQFLNWVRTRETRTTAARTVAPVGRGAWT